jgi:alpha-N-arabinofuranosidase
MSYLLETKMEFTPENNKEEAGLVMMQNNSFHYRLVSMLKNNVRVIRVIRCLQGEEEVLGEIAYDNAQQNEKNLWLRVSAKLQELEFSYSLNGANYHIVKAGVDGRILSTDVAGGFVGTTFGLYCSGNGSKSNNYADFDWLSYQGQ